VPYLDDQKSFVHKNVESNTIDGDIVYIHVDNGGKNYTSVPEIEIRGDGSGATATAIMDGNSISKIQISNGGSGYTYAEVKIFGNGTDASATAMISPPGGHGSDAVFELGAFYVETNVDIIGSEDGIFQ